MGHGKGGSLKIRKTTIPWGKIEPYIRHPEGVALFPAKVKTPMGKVDVTIVVSGREVSRAMEESLPQDAPIEVWIIS